VWGRVYQFLGGKDRVHDGNIGGSDVWRDREDEDSWVGEGDGIEAVCICGVGVVVQGETIDDWVDQKGKDDDGRQAAYNRAL